MTDVTAIEKAGEGVEFVRPAYGGTVLERLAVSGPVQFATVRSGSFAKPGQQRAVGKKKTRR